MDNVKKMPFRKVNDPKALLQNVAEESGDLMENVLIIALHKDNQSVTIASTTADPGFLAQAHLLVMDVAQAAVYGEIADED
jgi:hypothetical protein